MSDVLASARRAHRPPWMLLAVAVAVLAIAYPWIGGSIYWTRQVYLIAILSLVVSGLNLSFGYAGQLALGQVAMYAAGAYMGGYCAVHFSSELAVCVIAGALAALVVGIVSGVPGLRLGGWSLAMVSFFLVLLIPDILQIFSDQTGGAVGLVGIPQPELFGTPLDFNALYVSALVITVLWFAVLRNLINSRHGASLLVLRQSPVLASSLGISVYRMKLTAYAVGAIPAGIAGALFASLTQFLDPTTFAFETAIVVLASSVLGGSASIYGAVFGAALMQIGPLRASGFQEYSLIVYGGFLIFTGVLLSQGVAGILRPLARRFVPSSRISTVPLNVAVAADRSIDIVPGDVLDAQHVTKRFGGVEALRDVSITARPGRITALIGPNGSGKTTLLNVISGFYTTNAGVIRLGRDELQGLPPHAIARKGVARTFQTPLVPTALTAAEAVSTGRYATTRLSIVAAVARLPAFWRTRTADGEAAAGALQRVGIADVAGREAHSLPLGTRRLVEVARALAARPRVVLLDEVASGLDDNDLEHLGTILRSIRDAGATVLLVEHNFRLVLELADEIFVLANGQLFASGTPEEIATHPGVLEQYLGVRAMDDQELAEVLHGSEERG